MCTRTRRHARFRIAFVEFAQYEDHRYQTRRRQQSIQPGLLARPERRRDDRIQLLFLIRTTTAGCLAPFPCRPRKRQGNNPGSKSRNNVTIYRKPKSQRLKHPRNHKQTEPMKLINIARSILVIGYVMQQRRRWRKRQWAAGNRPGTRTATPGHTLETGQRNQSRRRH